MMVSLLLRCSFAEVIQMKRRWLLALVPLSLALGLVFASPAMADPKGRGPSQDSDGRGWSDGRHHNPSRSQGFGVGHSRNSGNPGHVPELDPGLLGSAAVLLIGGTLVLHGRRRIENKA
jgi:hypothetical protein